MKFKNWLLAAAVGIGLAAFASPARADRKMIQIKGSDTMVNLVQILAEEYMAKNPGAAIAVLGGGSGTGITGLINGTCDIANHSREWKQKEIDLAWEKGVKPRFFAIAVDGLSIIVNESNTIERLTMAQVGSLYKGEIQELEGPRRPGQAGLALRTAVQLRDLHVHAGARPRQQELLAGRQGNERERPDHRGRHSG